MKSKIVRMELPREIAERYIEASKDAVRLDEFDVWLNTNGASENETLKSISFDNADTAALTDYGITTEELRATTSFAVACLTDSDVNHCLQYADCDIHQPTLQDRFTKELTAWMNCETNVPPVTPCGMVNYLVEHCGCGQFFIPREISERILP